MKKVLLFIAMLFANIMQTFAQDSIVLYIADRPESREVCIDNHDVFIIYAREGYEFMWTFGGYLPDSWDSPIIISDQLGYYNYFPIQYTDDGGFNHHFNISYKESHVPTSFTHTQWKRQAEADSLVAVGADSIGWPAFYQFLWSTGETTRTIEVTEPGTYTCEISELCGTATRTFIVKDNVELYRATVDLASGLNKVTWQTTPEQAEYISQVKVERDGMMVGTAPYGDGQFLDNIGSENAARNYRLTGITTEGDECPIPSYQLGTLHVDFSPNASNPNKLNMAWTAPYIEEGSPLTVSYFQICKYDPVTGEVTVVDQLGANNTIGSYNISLFEGGYATVAALFSEGRDYEEMSFSNMTEEILCVEENDGNQVRIYPNPAHGILYVETRRATSLPMETEYRIINPMGQTLMSGIVETCHGASLQQINIENLPQGMYFVTIGGVTRKIVVE